MKRNICIITGSRADYAHLSPVISAIKIHPDLSLQIVVTGQHLDERFGSTWKAISNDGHYIDEKINLELGDDSALDTARAIGRGIISISECLERLKPQIVVVLGDRFEIIAAAQAALILNIPLAHIHGGEITEGAFDDSIRHAITKMARLHFCAAVTYAERIKQMGEDPSKIFMVGAPGLDQISEIEYLDRESLSKEFEIDLSKQIFLITYHPVTLRPDNNKISIVELIKALSDFSDVSMIFTGVNSDPGNNVIKAKLEDFVSQDSSKRILFDSLGVEKYLSTMRLANLVIGNSSSGLIEAPALGVPTVNVGDRQKGRLSSPSVINCKEETKDIIKAINKALNPSFISKTKKISSQYIQGNAATKIASILAKTKIKSLITKPFYDIKIEKSNF